MPDPIDIHCKHFDGYEVAIADGYYWVICANPKCGKLLKCLGKYSN